MSFKTWLHRGLFEEEIEDFNDIKSWLFLTGSGEGFIEEMEWNKEHGLFALIASRRTFPGLPRNLPGKGYQETSLVRGTGLFLKDATLLGFS